MLNRRPAFGLAFAAFHAITAEATELPQLRFDHKDWEIACDNTRTCRAAGYQTEEEESTAVSVLLTRAAGPQAPVEADLQLAPSDEAPPW